MSRIKKTNHTCQTDPSLHRTQFGNLASSAHGSKCLQWQLHFALFSARKLSNLRGKEPAAIQSAGFRVYALMHQLVHQVFRKSYLHGLNKGQEAACKHALMSRHQPAHSCTHLHCLTPLASSKCCRHSVRVRAGRCGFSVPSSYPFPFPFNLCTRVQRRLLFRSL
jgi:hypothetical protein